MNDATWLADLLAHGLIRPSFVPPMEVQALRDLTRTRKQLTRERASHVQRIDKLLQAANLKLGSVLSDSMGQSGRVVLDALAARTIQASSPTSCARGCGPRARSLSRRFGAGSRAPGRRLLRLHLVQADSIDAAIAAIDQEVAPRLEPFRDAVTRLTTMPGLSHVSASVVVSEIGFDMSRFPTPAPLVSWAGLCPRNDESAGKRRSTKLRHGAPWLKTLLVQAAWAAVRVKASYHNARFHRLKARRGPRKAIVAVAASMLTALHVMLQRSAAYRDLGADHFERAQQQRLAHRLTQKLQHLGFDVVLTQRANTTVPC